MLKKINTRLDLWMIKNPYLLMLFLFLLLFGSQLLVNIYRNEPLFYNVESSLGFFWVYLIAYLASRKTTNKGWLFLICYLANFAIVLVSNYLNGGLVDYTSIILLGFLTILQALISFVLSIDFINRKNKYLKE